MTFALVVARLHLPEVRSLKEKRRVIKALMERVHHRFRVSIAETDFHDLHQRSEISLALVHRNDHEMHRMLDGVRRMFDAAPGAELTEWLDELVEGVS